MYAPGALGISWSSNSQKRCCPLNQPVSLRSASCKSLTKSKSAIYWPPRNFWGIGPSPSRPASRAILRPSLKPASSTTFELRDEVIVFAILLATESMVSLIVGFDSGAQPFRCGCPVTCRAERRRQRAARSPARDGIPVRAPPASSRPRRRRGSVFSVPQSPMRRCRSSPVWPLSKLGSIASIVCWGCLLASRYIRRGIDQTGASGLAKTTAILSVYHS